MNINFIYNKILFFVIFWLSLIFMIVNVIYQKNLVTIFAFEMRTLKTNQSISITQKNTTIFCLILTHPKYFFTRTIAVNNSWAYDCDDHRFISIIPKVFLQNNSIQKLNEDFIEINYPFRILQPSGYKQEKYINLTHKVIRN